MVLEEVFLHTRYFYLERFTSFLCLKHDTTVEMLDNNWEKFTRSISSIENFSLKKYVFKEKSYFSFLRILVSKWKYFQALKPNTLIIESNSAFQALVTSQQIPSFWSFSQVNRDHMTGMSIDWTRDTRATFLTWRSRLVKSCHSIFTTLLSYQLGKGLWPVI